MTNKKFLIIWVVAIIILFASASGYVMSATSSMEFCSEKCHEMGIYAEEMKYSVHAKDHDGNPITCANCHIPVDSIVDYTMVKAYSGIKDVYVHNFGDPDNLNRLELKHAARPFVSDANCMKCHTDLYKTADKKNDISELGKIAHNAYLGKDGQAKSKCVGCHTNIAHLPDFDTRYTVNKEFADRLANKEVYTNE